MKLRRVTCALILLALAAVTTKTEAQNAGFSVAIAPRPQQPPPARPVTAGTTPHAVTPVQPFLTSPVQPFFNSPVQPFVTSPVQQFGFGQVPVANFGFAVTPPMVPPVAAPAFPQNHSPFPQSPAPQQFHRQYAAQAFGQAGYSNYFNGVAGSGITVVAPDGTVFSNSTVVYEQPAAQAYSTWPQPAPQPGFTAPSVGTPRAQVIQRFGSPLTTVITMSGETLYFNGGVQIFIQNGRVALPN